ncbi:hypothetical protein PCC8801_3902 [Rippkaea orientalis PCC 8801]|uniref:Uncharacterized protein n=1 Tax=Rippkaea orientalis (strain PCC 8801 / RF-1) TaxID=41431 RepID=B7K525_RIPO1|nr:hypothetical protein PCC8801_3902 [Rippkaea orientalis PCC 8801]
MEESHAVLPVGVSNAIAQDDVIEVVHYYENGVETGGTRHLSLYSVSLHPDEPSVMKANWF